MGSILHILRTCFWADHPGTLCIMIMLLAVLYHEVNCDMRNVLR